MLRAWCESLGEAEISDALDDRRAHGHRDGSRLLTHAIAVVGTDRGHTLVARPMRGVCGAIADTLACMRKGAAPVR
jgi:hypothetical protein